MSHQRRPNRQQQKPAELHSAGALRLGIFTLSAALLFGALHIVRDSTFAPNTNTKTFGQSRISRSPYVGRLEEYLSHRQLGPCDGTIPIFPWMPYQACKPLDCVFSVKRNLPIDVSLFAWNILRKDEALNRECPVPVGGQNGDSGIPPKVSFILTVTNNEKLARQAVIELFRTALEVESVEFVVIDDGSEPELYDLRADLEAMHYYFGVPFKYQRNDESVGFGEANNMGVELAQGEYIVLVNSDMYPTRGWLSNLMHTLETYPNAGQVGPLFFGEDLKVQEAGAIMWADGHPYQAGGSKDPHPFYLHARPVDYVSAACVAMKRDLFLSLGSFKPIYGRGYFEDTDMSMEVRKVGKHVVFQPFSVVFHQGGSTLGAAYIKYELIETNMEIFYNQWKDTLQAHCPSSAGLYIGAHRLRYPNFLVIDSTVPMPDRDSGSVRMQLILEALLAENLNVVFQGLDWVPRRYDAALAEMGVMVMPRGNDFGWILDNGSEECLFDTILIARRPIFESVIAPIKALCPKAKIIFDTVDLHFLREARDSYTFNFGEWDFTSLNAEKIWNWLETSDDKDADIEKIRKSSETELKCIDAANTTIVVSHEEARLLKMIRPDINLAIVSNMYKLPEKPTPWTAKECAERDGIIFIGNMNHTPNIRALHVLTRDILPIVNGRLGDKAPVLHVVGSNAIERAKFEKILRLKIVYHFSLSDEELDRVYKRMRVSVAPLMSGAGVKGKVAQALLSGVPVVATPIAGEGMHLVHEESVLIGRDPVEFAENIIRLFEDCNLCNKVRQEGFSAIQREFSFEEGAKNVSTVLESLGVETLGHDGEVDFPCRFVNKTVVEATDSVVATTVEQPRGWSVKLPGALEDLKLIHACAASLPIITYLLLSYFDFSLFAFVKNKLM